MKLKSSIFCRKRLATFCLLFAAFGLEALAAGDGVIGAVQVFLERSAQKYTQQNHLQARPKVRVEPLDARLREPRCTKPLQLSLEGRQALGRVSVRVRCAAPNWTLLLPAQVQIHAKVLAASRPLKRGERLMPADFYPVERDIGTLQKGFLTDIRAIENQQLTRTLSAGQVLLASHLKAAQLVARGEQVQILWHSSGIQVQMSGEALSGGSLGQQIRVRNLASQRVVRARVSAPGQQNLAPLFRLT